MSTAAWLWDRVDGESTVEALGSSSGAFRSAAQGVVDTMSGGLASLSDTTGPTMTGARDARVGSATMTCGLDGSPRK